MDEKKEGEKKLIFRELSDVCRIRQSIFGVYTLSEFRFIPILGQRH